MNHEITVAVIERAAADQAGQELALTQTVTEIERRAGAMTITTEEDYRQAADFGRQIKQRSSEVKDFWTPMKNAAHQAHTAICAREKAMLKPLNNAEKILKQTMGEYVAGQERRRRVLEEAARRAAQEEAERKMCEAIALEDRGDTAAAEAAMDEAEIMDTAAGAVTASKPKASGVTTRRDWKILSVDPEKVPTVVDGVEIRPVDTAAVMRLIRATKGQVKIPGIVYEETAQIGFRR